MGFISVSDAMRALVQDGRWSRDLDEEELALCLNRAERMLRETLEQTYTTIRGRLLTIGQIVPHANGDERMDVLKQLIE